ncbi:hypothetical protein AXG93_3036s1090 [Marchantia polymorpha subsp. ruderalis]|uniref:Uncharacterized protein n=1 Tax=Marchantia polymorpha subsp. ruderalis TaxID=1480154 RepID=A0A176W9B0_MARPO|nr:hypothetical protein AXG93_3036s1090 [Marchantia polymorpha subsp. ruderalis]
MSGVQGIGALSFDDEDAAETGAPILNASPRDLWTVRIGSVIFQQLSAGSKWLANLLAAIETSRCAYLLLEYCTLSNKETLPTVKPTLLRNKMVPIEQVLPSTADILRYFKDLPSKPSRVEVVDEFKRPDPSISLSQLYFPSKKHVDSSSVQKIQEQSGDESQPVGPTKINRGKMLPNTDLSRLDSTSLLKNLDAALADISRSANPMAVPSKKDRQCLEMDSAKRSKSLLFKLPTREKPSRNQKSSGRAVKTDTAEDLSSSKHDKCSHALCSGYCSEESSNLSSASDDRAENPSMFITLMRKKQENVSNVLGKQSGEISGLHLGDSKSLLSAAHFSARSSEQPSRVEACETKPKDLFGHLEIAGLEDSCNPLQSIQSGQNPLLSCEKLGQWMDSLAGSSTASYRAKPGDLEASPCRQRASSKSKTEIWWQSTDQIPNYLSTRSLGPALPDYGSIWTQVDDYSDSHEQSPCVISSSEKSDFSCSPEISLSSSTRISSFDYSCSSLDPLASSTRLAMLKDPCASTQTLDSTGIRT